MKHSRKHKSKSRRHTRRRSTRRRGGMAPVSYHLSGSWPSRMSLGQGADYFKYHEGQHGGAAPFPGSIGQMLPQELRSPAHVGGIDKAMNDIAGLKDQAGGKRKRRSTKRKGSKRRVSKRHSKRHSRKHRKTHRRHRRSGGSALGYAPFPSTGMLLSSNKAYAEAGLNPEWKTAVEFTDAKIRDTQ